MTIPEAVQLVIQAGAMGEGGELFLLEMGEPVKISDLAENLIRLSGLTPGDDIEIVYTGLRPGEKLYEELLTDGEGIKRTHHNKIWVLGGQTVNAAALFLSLECLDVACRIGNNGEVKKVLKELIPEYQPYSDEQSLNRIPSTTLQNFEPVTLH